MQFLLIFKISCPVCLLNRKPSSGFSLVLLHIYINNIGLGEYIFFFNNNFTKKGNSVPLETLTTLPVGVCHSPLFTTPKEPIPSFSPRVSSLSWIRQVRARPPFSWPDPTLPHWSPPSGPHPLNVWGTNRSTWVTGEHSNYYVVSISNVWYLFQRTHHYLVTNGI